MKKSGRLIRRILIFFLALISFSAMAPFLLALTPAPFFLHYRLGKFQTGPEVRPVYILFLGGGGMPSESNLMRIWYTADAANQFPEARIVIAQPSDTTFSGSSANLLRNELIIRGINKERILFEPEGRNTRAQALQLFEITEGTAPTAVVTSPEHMKRSLLTLRKAGYSQLWGIPAFENPNDAPLEFEDDQLGGNRTGVPKIGRKLGLRYHFWTQLNYERLVVREYLALAYYKMKGWI